MASFIFRVGLKSCRVQPSVFMRTSLVLPTRRIAHQASAPHVGVLRRAQRHLPLLLKATSLAGIGLGISSLTFPATLDWDAVSPSEASATLLPPPKTSVDAYELIFGIIFGLCVGIFVKKRLHMVALFLCGLFIVLQYFGSVSVSEDCAQMKSQFEGLLYTTDAAGNEMPPTVWSIWKWVVDFLMGDIQHGEPFVAGFVLGLWVG